MINPLTHIIGIFSIGISRVKINRVSFKKQNGQATVIKTRTPLSWILIAIGNFVFQFRGSPVRVLHTTEWIAWESIIQHLTSGDFPNQPEPPSRLLVLNKIPGQKLDNLLNQSSHAHGLKLCGIATQSLYQFHQHPVKLKGNEKTLLSHGDASVHNVLIDEENLSATWFDFDLRHNLDKPKNWRHADDLRALLFTTACYFRTEQLDELIRVIRLNYQSEEVWSSLRQQIGCFWFDFDVFHAAQIRRCRSIDTSRPPSDISYRRINSSVRDLLLRSQRPLI